MAERQAQEGAIEDDHEQAVASMAASMEIILDCVELRTSSKHLELS